MRFLGEGRSSLAFALDGLEVSSLLVASGMECDSAVVRLDASSCALRVFKQQGHQPIEEPTVKAALLPYLGDHVMLPMSDYVSTLLAEMFPPSETQHSALLHSITGCCLMPNFSAPIPETTTRSTLRIVTYEIKPKAVWEYPRYVGARFVLTDGRVVQRLLSPLKLHQCRYSLMQHWKCQQKRQKGFQDVVPLSKYCPNDLLLHRNLQRSLQSLRSDPQNNFRKISDTTICDSNAMKTTNGQVDEAQDLFWLEKALSSVDVCQQLVALQRRGAACCSGGLNLETDIAHPVLDIELLQLWEQYTAKCNMLPHSDVKEGSFELLHACAPPCDDCRCQEKRAVPDATGRLHTVRSQGQWHAPRQAFESALDRFYVATTAKDVSVVVTLQHSLSDSGTEQRASPPLNECSGGSWSRGCAGRTVALRDNNDSSGIATTARIAVIDIDCKRHKPLDAYLRQDCDIVAAAASAGI